MEVSRCPWNRSSCSKRRINPRYLDGEAIARRYFSRNTNPIAQYLLDFQFDALDDIRFGYPVGIGRVIEVEIPRKKLPSWFVEFRASNILWEEKAALLIAIRDITAQKLMTNALLQSDIRARARRGKFKYYPDNSNTILVGLDMGGRITFINKKGREVLGYEDKEILGKKWSDHFIPARCQQKACDIFHRELGGEMGYQEFCEKAIITRQGEERLISWHNTCLKDERGNCIGILSAGDYVTGCQDAGTPLKAGEDKVG